MNIISLSGQYNTGKDTICDYLVKKLNVPLLEEDSFSVKLWERTAFADAVKQVYGDAFGVSRDFIEKWKRIPEVPEGMLMNVRKGLQFIGDGFRQIKPDIWIEIALRPKWPDACNSIIISDSRYINEAKQVKAKGGVNIVLWRPSMENDDPNPSESQIKPIVDWCVRTHQDGPIFDIDCENPPNGIEYYDYFMRNDGDLTALYRRVDEQLIPWLQNGISNQARENDSSS